MKEIKSKEMIKLDREWKKFREKFRWILSSEELVAAKKKHYRKTGKWNSEVDCNEIRDKKRGSLAFHFDNYKINKFWECINDGYKIIPSDLTIHRMGENPNAHEELWFLMSSKTYFATGFDGKKCDKGIIELDHEKKEIRFKRGTFK